MEGVGAMELMRRYKHSPAQLEFRKRTSTETTTNRHSANSQELKIVCSTVSEICILSGTTEYANRDKGKKN